MQPEPLVRVTSDVVFDHAREHGGVGDDVSLVVAGAEEFERGIEAQDIFSELAIPGRESRHDRRIRAQGDAREAAGRVRGDAEEIYEYALRRRHVGVHEDADNFAGAHGGEQAADEVVFADGFVAMHGAVALDERVDIGIVQRAHDD